MTTAAKFQSKTLRRPSTPQAYRVYRAGLEWDLAAPAVIGGADDLKSAGRWRDRLTPHPHQIANLVAFFNRLPASLVADEAGLGKTVGAGLIVSELMARGRISRVLVVAPTLLGAHWTEELETRFGIRAEMVSGRALAEADPGEAGAVITTYGSARLHIDDIPADRFQMLILDGAHALRSLHGAERPPLVATRLRKALEDRRFGFVLMLTATPIRDRLWDLYSLVDLVAAARGHANPLGSEDRFARRFIADRRGPARELRPEAREEFRAIVHGCLSRVRRGEAGLRFADRAVRMHRVEPTQAERDLITAMIKPVRRLTRPAQIALLQALASSPEALAAQLAAMTKAGTVPPEFAARVAGAAAASAKLVALADLIDGLEAGNLVVFTGRAETQAAIRAFLESRGVAVGVIVATDAGCEGLELQGPSVLVNYDLPWNPVIAEQRIGRIRRLAADPAPLDIVNLVLRGTFEDTIVGRLAGVLQTATRTIGDLEALLLGPAVADGDDDAAAGFEDRILDLVLDALAGKDVDTEAGLAELGIEAAKAELDRAEAAIDALLGGTDDAGHAGPRAPSLPGTERSMAPREFTLAALGQLGARLTPKSAELYLVEAECGREYIRFEAQAATDVESTLYAPGSAAFRRLVGRVIATGLHAVDDLDDDPARQAEAVARRWAEGFGARATGVDIVTARRSFGGVALMRVRASVAHDSYERLVEVRCAHDEHRGEAGPSNLASLGQAIEDPATLGIDVTRLAEAAGADAAIGAFCRFYLERRDQEVRAAEDDEGRRAALEDAFTPRVEITLVGLEGRLYRTVEARVRYAFDTESGYEDALTVVPHTGEVIAAPSLGHCAHSDRMVPRPCLSRCDISGAMVLGHLLVVSQISQRLALPEFSALCSLSGQRVLTDELETSAVTGKPVASALLSTSGLSGKRGEPEHFGRCAFTGAVVLNDELALSEISAKPYRIDEQMRSAVSAKTGHAREFVVCHETRQPVAIEEAEKCAVTGYAVRPGVLESCAVTGQRVLPTELEGCAVTGQRVLKRLLVTSSLSGLRVRRDVAVRSSGGRFCTPAEAHLCLWSGRMCHPDDLRTCALTGLAVHFELATTEGSPRLLPLVEILDGIGHAENETQRWDSAANRIAVEMHGGRCRVEAATLSPARQHLAVCAEVRTFLGIKARQVGAVYDIAGDAVVGRLAVGKRGRHGWIERRP
jgi:hypothetical protein